MKGYAVAAIAVLVLSLTACGSSPSHASGPVGSKAVAFSRCMRSHGTTNFPDPLPGGGFNITGNTNSQQFQAADNTCRATLGSSGSDGS